MQEKMSLITIALVLCMSRIAASVDLAQVCQDDAKSPILIRNVSEVQQLVEELKSNSEACIEEYHDSILQLESLLSEKTLNDACSDTTTDAVEAYHSKFIHYFSTRKEVSELKQSKGLPKDQRTKPIPRALYLFFIGYVKHLNAACRTELPGKLRSIVEEQQLVSDQDFAAFKEFTSAENLPMKSVRAKVNKWIAGGSINSLHASDSDDRYHLALPDKTNLPNISAVCQQKFLPILDEALRPIVRLNELGYSGKDYISKDTASELRSEPIKRWFGAFQICEAIRNADLIIIPKEVCKASKKEGGQFKCKYGFVPAEKVEEFKKMSVEESVTSVEPVGEIGHLATGFDGELRYITSIEEAEQAARALKSELNAAVKVKTNPIIVKELQMVERLMKLYGLQPIPKGGLGKGGKTDWKVGIAISIIVVVVVIWAMVFLFG